MSIEFTGRYSVALLLAFATACSKHNAGMDTTSAAGAIAPDTNAPSAMAPSGAVTPTAPVPPALILMVATKPGMGAFLADGNSRAVYVLDHAPSDTNSWKPVNGSSAPTTTDTGIKAAMLGTTTGPSGMQATYGGKALYYYSGDQAANDTNGSGKTESGATGHLVRPSGGAANGKHNGMKR